MTTYYFQPLPQIPDAVLSYCSQHNYQMSLKKKYIVSQIIAMHTATDIDELLLRTRLLCSNISKSSIYQVLQWMINHDLVLKTNVDDNLRVLYLADISKLNSLISIYSSISQAQPSNIRHASVLA